MPCNTKEIVMTADYQNDYRNMYEELRAVVRLYFEIKHDDGTVYDDWDWEKALEEVEIDLMLMVGLIEEADENSLDYP
jgi:hypothetical protein